MSWKNWPYWLKGGIIGFGIFLVFMLPLGLFLPISKSIAIIYFLVGAFFGLIYGKLKSVENNYSLVGGIFGFILGAFTTFFSSGDCRIGYCERCEVSSFCQFIQSLFPSKGIEMVLPWIILIIFGSLIGFIVGKIKSRNQGVK